MHTPSCVVRRRGAARAALLLAAALVLAVAAVVVFLQPPASPNEPASPADHPRTPAQRAMVRAEDMLSAGQTRAAVEHLEAFLAAHPSEIPPRAMLARIYLATDQLDPARKHIDRALADDADHPAALWVRGLLAVTQGQDPEPYFARAAGQDNAGPIIHAEYGLYLMDRGRAGQAEPHLRRAVEAELPQATVYEALAQVDFQAGRFEEAAELARRATELDATSLRAWALLGEACRQQGQLDRAAEALEEAVRHAGPDQKGGVLMQVARLQQSRKQWPEAVATCREVMKLSPSLRPMAALRMAICLYFAEQYDDAADAIAVARRAGPDDPEVNLWFERIDQARQSAASKPGQSDKPTNWLDAAPPEPSPAPSP
jgi:tetratricopeptide (TPR) repeat protein